MLKIKKFVMVKLFLVVLLFMVILTGTCASSGKEDIELRIGWMLQMNSIDPVYQSTNWEFVVANNVYDSLVYPNPSSESLFDPWIAESWEISNDLKTYTFNLKKGIKFHDGSEVTAEDVVFSMDRQQAIGGHIASFFGSVKVGSTKVVDSHTVAFNLDKPDPAFLSSSTVFKILNKDQVLAHIEPGSYGEFGDYGIKWLDENDAGSGPYKVVERIHGDRTVLEKFEDYALREWGHNSIDRVVINIIPELVTISTKIKMGEIDLADWTLIVDIMNEIEEIEGIIVERDPVDVPWYLILNNSRPPLDDIYVRKAMAYAFDYETLINDVMGGGVRAQGPVPNNVAGHNDNVKVYPTDLEKAKELIKKSKYSEEELSKYELKITAVSGSVRFVNLALLAASNFKEIGLNVGVEELRWADICQRQTKPETASDMSIIYQTGLIPHPQQYLYYFTPETWGSAHPTGGIYYENPEVTEAIEKAKVSSSIEEQFEWYRKAQEIIVEESVCLFLHNEILNQPMWRYVKGYEMPEGSFQFYQFRFDKYWMDTSDEFYKHNHR